MSDFHTCTCGHGWPSLDDFLTDPAVKLVGYQVNYKHLSLGLFLFNHRCRTTLAIEAGEFLHLYQGPAITTRPLMCGNHCLHQEDLEPCPAQCECAYVRHVLQMVREWPKRNA